MTNEKKLDLGMAFFLICAGLVYLSSIGIEVKAGSFEGSNVLGAQVAHDSSVFPAISSAVMTGQGAISILVTTGPVIVYGVHVGSSAQVNGNALNYIVFFDTGPTSGAGNVSGVSTVTAVQMPGSGDLIRQFNPPLRLFNGLTMRNGSGCVSTGLAGWCYTVLYDKIGTRVGR